MSTFSYCWTNGDNDQADAKIKELLQQPEIDYQVYELLAFLSKINCSSQAAEDAVKIGLSWHQTTRIFIIIPAS